MKSLWKQTAPEPTPRASLSGPMEVDVAIIGGGMAGILTAYLLGRRGVNCAVFEANRVGGGQTQGSTGKVTSQHGLIYGQLVERFGVEKARQYALSNQQAVEQYRTIVGELGIQCGFSRQDAYLYSRNDAQALLNEAKTAAALGLPASFVEDPPLPFSVAGAVRFTNQAQMDPLAFLYGVSSNLRVYEHSPVTRVEGNVLTVNGYPVHGDQIVFACHYPFVNVPGYYFLRMHQSRSYSLALAHTPPISGMFFGVDSDGLSIRTYRDILILCGMNHRTGENSAGGRYDDLRKMARELFPGCREIAHWSAQDCMTPDSVPYIGPYCASEPDWLVATGFNKWGITGSMAAAMLLCDHITGRKNPNAEVYSPQRFNLPTLTGVLSNGGQAVKGLSRQTLAVPQETLDALPMGHGGVLLVEGEKVGVYKDMQGQTYLVDTRCPHLGCQVEWNPDEKSWDCPCHGSRFDYRGGLIDNPAQTALTLPDNTIPGQLAQKTDSRETFHDMLS